MQGYWQRAEATAEPLLKNGWLERPVNVGPVDSMRKASSSLVDRKKDMILVSGFNVYPQ